VVLVVEVVDQVLAKLTQVLIEVPAVVVAVVELVSLLEMVEEVVIDSLETPMKFKMEMVVLLVN
jgi:hypothetical protein